MAVMKKTSSILSDRTEYELFKEYRETRDKQLRDELVSAYIYIAEILSRKFINRGLEYDDIYQIACIGILSSIDRFDPDKGVKFATYATPTVLGEIRHYFRDKGSFIRVPRTLYEVFCKAERIRRSSNGEQMSTAELARILNLNEHVIKRAYTVGDTAFIKSLEDEAYADGNLNISHTIGSEDNHYIMIENEDFIQCCIKSLTEQEVEFVQLRYYQEWTQKQISEKWDVSQMYISRMERSVLKKLRNLYFRD